MNDNDILIKKAIKKIKEDSKCKKNCINTIIGPTGPTHTLKSERNEKLL